MLSFTESLSLIPPPDFVYSHMDLNPAVGVSDKITQTVRMSRTRSAVSFGPFVA